VSSNHLRECLLAFSFLIRVAVATAAKIMEMCEKVEKERYSPSCVV
jgi:hypothetical protein